MKSKQLAIDVISALFILLFTYTALSKLTEFESFQAMIKESPLIGDKYVAVSWLIPITEIIVSVLLLIPSLKRLGLYASLALMTVFTLYLGYMLIFASHLPCSCGGVIGTMTWKQHFAFNIFFTLLSIIAIFLDKRSKKADPNTKQAFSVSTS